MAGEVLDLMKPVSGLIEECEATILAIVAKQPEGYPSKQIVVTLGTDNPDHPEITEKYNVSDKWEIIDGGSEILHVSGTPKPVESASQFGQFVGRVYESAAREITTERAGGNPAKIQAYAGLKFRFERVEKDWSIPARNGQPAKSGTTTKLYPVEFLGTDGSTPVSGTTETPDAMSALVELAKSTDSQAAFQAEAIKIAGANKFLGDIVSGKIFAEANGA